MKRFFIVHLLVLAMFLFTGCTALESMKKDPGPPEVPRYTKFNIHGQQKSKSTINASYANWTGPFQGHMFVPMNTKVTVTPKRRGLTIFMVETGQEINFQYDEKRMEMSADEYIDLITSPKPVSMKSFSKIDRKGIKKGRVFKGMTKKGVMAAFGYPATHKTFSTENNQWVYWKSRYGSKVVFFNTSGKVKSVKY